MRTGLGITMGLSVAALAGLTATFEHPPVRAVQNGYRGTGQANIFNPRQIESYLATSALPEVPPQEKDGGDPAGQVYQNVQVLKDVPVAEFGRLMASITTWVSPDASCAYCHEGSDFASDKLYTKVVARRMIQMVQHINAHWTNHVGADVGVTCYTCHRGQPVPVFAWTRPDPPHAVGMVESLTGKKSSV